MLTNLNDGTKRLIDQDALMEDTEFYYFPEKIDLDSLRILNAIEESIELEL